MAIPLVSDKVSNPGLASIAESSSKLVQLRTVGFQVTDEGLVPLTKLSNLRVLELSKSPQTSKSCHDQWLQFLKLVRMGRTSTTPSLTLRVSLEQ